MTTLTQPRAGRRHCSRKPAATRTAPMPEERPPPRLDLDALASVWQRSLDASQQSLGAAAGTLPAPYLREHARELAHERAQTADILAAVARAHGSPLRPWLSPVQVRPAMLGLPGTVEACLFDLDGVLTNSAALHAWAWSVVFDELLLRSSEETGWQFIPFAPGADYRAYIDGRPRLEGIHAFLDSRGIRLPEGRVDDPPGARTACGLARRKGELVLQGLRQRGVAALPGVRRYLEAAGRAGVKRAVLSASANAKPMLELAALTPLVEVQADADLIRSEGARTAPAPDLLLAACRRLEVAPENAAAFTHSAAGVAAGRTAGATVVGVAEGAQSELLRGVGAGRVVPSMLELLDRRLL